MGWSGGGGRRCCGSARYRSTCGSSPGSSRRGRPCCRGGRSGHKQRRSVRPPGRPAKCGSSTRGSALVSELTSYCRFSGKRRAAALAANYRAVGTDWGAHVWNSHPCAAHIGIAKCAFDCAPAAGGHCDNPVRRRPVSATATTNPNFSFVLEHPAAEPAAAERHFLSKLGFETDPADVHLDLERGHPGIVVVDTRSPDAYARCHIPGAINLPTRTIGPETTAFLPRDKVIVAYCWGPGCNGSNRAAAKLAALGFRVKEMIGGLGYSRKGRVPGDAASPAAPPPYAL